MPQQAWSKKQERQYQHVKASQKDEGRGEGRAEEIAARTVNRERARSGQSRQRSKTSTQGASASQRGGKRSGSGPSGRTKAQLYNDARRAGVKGRSTMTKAQLQKALAR